MVVNRILRAVGCHPLIGKVRELKGQNPRPQIGAYSLAECMAFAIYSGDRKTFRQRYGAVYGCAARNGWLPVINQALAFDKVTPASVSRTFKRLRVTVDGKVYEIVIPYSLNL